MSTSHNHNASRLEAFSDGVFAVIITITVIEMKTPISTSLAGLVPIAPVLLSYVLSFIYLIIYWNNHHHLVRHVHRITPGVMWANAALLFFLSLTPFATIWLGENGVAVWPAVFYGALQFLAAMAYYVLQSLIVNDHSHDSQLKQQIGRDWKGKISPLLYLIGIFGAFITPWISYALYAVVALLWIVPDRRFGETED